MSAASSCRVTRRVAASSGAGRKASSGSEFNRRVHAGSLVRCPLTLFPCFFAGMSQEAQVPRPGHDRCRLEPAGAEPSGHVQLGRHHQVLGLSMRARSSRCLSVHVITAWKSSAIFSFIKTVQSRTVNTIRTRAKSCLWHRTVRLIPGTVHVSWSSVKSLKIIQLINQAARATGTG
jgi:hypothetical protein